MVYLAHGTFHCLNLTGSDIPRQRLNSVAGGSVAIVTSIPCQ